MPSKRKKSISSVCPKTGKRLSRKSKSYWAIWLFPFAGLVLLIWFLIRVIPKPSRATYPCQRLAAPFASGFIVWLTGLIGSTLAYRKARRFFHQSRYVLAAICVAVAVMAIWWPLNITDEKPAKAWTPTEPPNTSMGTGKGIYPGRVVWLHEPDATSWNGSTGSWWDDNNTDQAIVHRMVSKTVQSLTGQSNDPNAWDALFRHFNQTHGFGNVGYTYGEKIVIKINMNQDSGGGWWPAAGMPSPHVIYSVLDQLINVADVPCSAITIYDASRYIGDPIYNKIKNDPDLNFQQVKFVVNPSYAHSGRNGAVRDTSATVHSSYPGCPDADMPLCVTQAKYMINMALLRPHSLYGITLCAKNHYGSVYCGGWTPSPLHSYGDRGRPMGSYNCLVDLIGSKHLSGKTILYMIDGLYPAKNQGADVIRYQSFGNDWCSSIFVSQDPVAIDSVALDFMRNEPQCTDVTGNPDNYLHEAALAHDPCSGTFYDPDGGGMGLASLGTHEHWNHPTTKQYSRNLGFDKGIELVQASLPPPDERVVNLTTGSRYEHIRYAISDTAPGDQIVVNPGIYLEKVDFLGKNLTLRSIDPNDPAVVASTVIRGRSYAPVVIFYRGEGPTSVLAGFTITGGNTGIYCYGASPTITNCVVTGNFATGHGGGIRCQDYSYPMISNCTISGNSAVDGGGIYSGQPVSPPPPFGSAPAATSVAGTLTATNCTITNCVVTGNTAQRGGGMYNSGTAPVLTNCIFSGNVASVAVGGLYNYSSNPALSNCILWGDTPPEIYVDGTGTTVISYSNVQGDWPGTANIDADPLFIDAEGPDEIIGTADDNLRLSAASPCVDTGDNTSVPVGITTDLDGHPRIADGDCNDTEIVDMGVYEFGYAYAGDFDGQCDVDFDDIAILTLAWLTEDGQPKYNPACDISIPADKFIDWRDLDVLGDNWLAGK